MSELNTDNAKFWKFVSDQKKWKEIQDKFLQDRPDDTVRNCEDKCPD